MNNKYFYCIHRTQNDSERLHTACMHQESALVYCLTHSKPALLLAFFSCYKVVFISITAPIDEKLTLLSAWVVVVSWNVRPTWPCH